MSSLIEQEQRVRIFSIIVLYVSLSLSTVNCRKEDPIVLPLDEISFEESEISALNFLVFPGLSVHQSMVFFEGKSFFLMSEGESLTCDIYDLSTKNKDVSISLPYDGYSIPHANVSCFGDRLFSKDSICPLLYVSAWNNKHQAFVYDISFEKGSYKSGLKQVIDPSLVSSEIIGKGNMDWVVDGENGRLFSIAYGLNSTTISEGNSTHITQFNLPSIENSYVVLHDSDVVDHFLLPVMNVFQDKFYLNDCIFVVAGIANGQMTFPPKLYKIDLTNKTLSELYIPLSGEPEGLCYYRGVKWLNMYGSSKVYNLDKLLEL